MSHGVNCSWLNTEMHVTSNHPTGALVLGVHYKFFCQSVLWTIEFNDHGYMADGGLVNT